MRPSPELRASSIYRLSGLFQPAHGRSSLSQTLAAVAPLRRRGLRRRLSAILIAATLGPVIAVSVVAVALIFSSVEQGIEFETVRGLQVARSLFLQEVQEVSARASVIGDDPELLRAVASAPARVGERLGELSRRRLAGAAGGDRRHRRRHRPLRARRVRRSGRGPPGRARCSRPIARR